MLPAALDAEISAAVSNRLQNDDKHDHNHNHVTIIMPKCILKQINFMIVLIL